MHIRIAALLLFCSATLGVGTKLPSTSRKTQDKTRHTNPSFQLPVDRTGRDRAGQGFQRPFAHLAFGTDIDAGIDICILLTIYEHLHLASGADESNRAQPNRHPSPYPYPYLTPRQSNQIKPPPNQIKIAMSTSPASSFPGRAPATTR